MFEHFVFEIQDSAINMKGTLQTSKNSYRNHLWEYESNIPHQNCENRRNKSKGVLLLLDVSR